MLESDQPLRTSKLVKATEKFKASWFVNKHAAIVVMACGFII
jgi:hypothetical protein